MRGLTYSGMEAGREKTTAQNGCEHEKRTFLQRIKDRFENMKESVCLFAARFRLAAGFTCLAAAGCYGATNLVSDTPDVQEESDGGTEAVDEGTEPPDVLDVADDGEDRIEATEDVLDAEDASDESSLSCPAPADPLEGDIDPTYAKRRETFIRFEGPSGSEINTDVIQEAGMVVSGPLVELGRCTDPDATAAIAAPGASISATPDVSVTAGSSRWIASVPVSGGELCDPVSPDNVPLRTFNESERTIVKNAEYAGVPSQAEFTLRASEGLLIVNDEASSGPVLVSGSAFAPVTTVYSALAGGGEINVHAYTSMADVEYNYTALLENLRSRQLRIYPVASGDSQMYEVNWDVPSEVIWCARCSGRETVGLTIPGEAIARVTDSCGFVGDGFDLTVTAVLLSTEPPHLVANYSEQPSGRVTSGISAMSTTLSGFGIGISLQRSSVTLDTGERVDIQLQITLEKVSEHPSPTTGANERTTESITIRVVDPWTWGRLTPRYDTDCGCTPVL